MKAIVFSIIILLATVSFAVDYPTFFPSYKKGLSWEIQLEWMTEERPSSKQEKEEFIPETIYSIYKFEVEGEDEIDGKLYYVIKLREIGSFMKKEPRPEKLEDTAREQYRLYIGKKSMRLESVSILGATDDKLKSEVIWDDGAFLFNAGRLPLSYPPFNQIDTKKFRTSSLKVKSGEKKFKTDRHNEVVLQKASIAKEALNGVDREVMNIEITDEMSNDKTIEKWIKGLPWWYEASYFVNNNVPPFDKQRELYKMRLVSVNGEKIEDVLKKLK